VKGMNIRCERKENDLLFYLLWIKKMWMYDGQIVCGG
jgi:hypothetical protein